MQQIRGRVPDLMERHGLNKNTLSQAAAEHTHHNQRGSEDGEDSTAQGASWWRIYQRERKENLSTIGHACSCSVREWP
jgi:hypothetical protein